MKVLEVKGFMHFPRDYEGGHEVIRWGIGASGGPDGKKTGIAQVLKAGWSLKSEVASLGVDVIVCQCFGMGYGREGGRFVEIRHRAKACYEAGLIQLVRRIKKECGVPLAVVDISDDPTIHPVNEPLLDMADLYFKRELPLDPYHTFESLRKKKARASAVMDRSRADREGWVEKLEPLSLGCAAMEPDTKRFKPADGKRWDLFYAGDDVYKPRRSGVVESLQGLAQRGWRVRVPDAPMEIEDYLEDLSRSRLAISPPGLGWDCHRHYEAAFVGTVPVTPFPTIRRHEPFLDGEHCLFYDPEKELGPQLEAMLDDPERLDQIGIRASEHANRHHTFEKIFDHVVTRTAGGRAGAQR